MSDRKLFRNGFIVGAAGLAAGTGYFLLLRPKMLRWGATPSEACAPLPGDRLVAHASVETTRAITIRAHARKVWPWIAQIGQGRGGFYSYDWLENLFGMDIHNADRVLPEYQDLKVGDTVPFWKGAGIQAVEVVPERHLALAGTLYRPEGLAAEEAGGSSYGGSWVFVLHEVDDRRTRLVVRSRIASFEPAWLSLLMTRLAIEPPQFVMERRMLIGIKQRAEGKITPKGGFAQVSSISLKNSPSQAGTA